jgi:hypothetical protein
MTKYFLNNVEQLKKKNHYFLLTQVFGIKMVI